MSKGIINTIQEKKLAEICDSLKSYTGARLTLCKMSEWGGSYADQITLVSVKIENYAQYDIALFITFKRRGARNARQLVLLPGSAFALFDGWRTSTEKAPNCFECFSKSLFYKIVDGITDGEKIAEFSERVFEDVAGGIPRKYIIVTEDGAKWYDGIQDIKRYFEITGELHDDIRRAELQGAPIIKGLCGPMYDGERDGAAVIRYETRGIYDALSI